MERICMGDMDRRMEKYGWGYELRELDAARPDRTGAFYIIRKGEG